MCDLIALGCMVQHTVLLSPPHPVSHVSVVLFFVVCFDSRCIRVADNING